MMQARKAKIRINVQAFRAQVAEQGNQRQVWLYISHHAVHTGIPDLATHHDNYLYGILKRDVKESPENENSDKI